jgi:hypothetical protein
LDFNLEIDFPPPGEPTGGDTGSFFTDGESISWTISGVSTADFLAPIDTNQTPYMMVHAQSLSNGESVKFVNGPTPNSFPMPEPGALAVFGAGLIGIGVVRRRRSRCP